MNRDGDVEYKSYSPAELQEALDSINAAKYPQNHHKLLAEFRSRSLTPALAATPRTEQIAVRPPSLEHLVSTTLLSMLVLIYGGYKLYSGNAVIPTRMGVQHVDVVDAIAFYTCVIISVPTNSIMLWTWIRDGDGTSNAYRTSKRIQLVAIALYVVYSVFDLFAAGV